MPKPKPGEEEEVEENDDDILDGFSDEDKADIRKAAAARHLAWRKQQRESKKVTPPKRKGWDL